MQRADASARMVSWFGRLLLLTGLLLGAGGSWAQAAVVTVPAARADAAVPVVVENRTLFTFRAPFGAFTPQQRADAARERVRAIVGQGGPLVVSVERRGDTAVVLVDGQPGFAILPGDVNPLLHETLEELTARTVERLQEALDAYEERQKPTAMLRAAAAAVALTAAFVGVVWALLRLRRALTRRIDAALERSLERVRGVLNLQTLAGITHLGVALVAWGIGLSAAYVWLTYLLAAFPFTRPWGLQLEGFLLDTLGGIALAIVHAMPDLFVVVVIVLLTRAVVRIAAAFFDGIEAGRISLGMIDSFTAPMTRRLVTAFLWVFALALAYPYLPGSDTDAFKGLSVLVGLMISLGASSVIGQAASGLILTYSHAFKPGEYVRIGNTEGTMKAIGMFTTHIETGLGELVVLPNSFVLSNTTTNYSRAVTGTPEGIGFVVDTTVTIGYATPWRQVHAMLRQAALRTTGVAADPPPRVAQTELSDFYVAYRLICYSTQESPRKRALLMSELHAHIQDVFNEHGVQIMSPHYVADPPQAQVVPKDKWFEPPAERSVERPSDAPRRG